MLSQCCLTYWLDPVNMFAVLIWCVQWSVAVWIWCAWWSVCGFAVCGGAWLWILCVQWSVTVCLMCAVGHDWMDLMCAVECDCVHLMCAVCGGVWLCIWYVQCDATVDLVCAVAHDHVRLMCGGVWLYWFDVCSGVWLWGRLLWLHSKHQRSVWLAASCQLDIISGHRPQPWPHHQQWLWWGQLSWLTCPAALNLQGGYFFSNVFLLYILLCKSHWKCASFWAD